MYMHCVDLYQLGVLVHRTNNILLFCLMFLVPICNIKLRLQLWKQQMTYFQCNSVLQN